MSSLPGHLVLFDGVCGFCDGAVRWLIAHDPHRCLHFAPLQGETAAALRARHPEVPDDLDSAVLVEPVPGGERIHLRARAVLRTLALLGAPWRWLAALRVLPDPLLDAAYRAFAARRYRWFGRLDVCRLPTPEERARFLP